jgi:hypothetical protein
MIFVSWFLFPVLFPPSPLFYVWWCWSEGVLSRVLNISTTPRLQMSTCLHLWLK